AEKRRQGMENVANIIKNQSQLTEKLVAEVENLKESSKRIENFVKTVDSIAGQTNLLAMNASIEAAHAGAMGKGFGVIAQEIRKLSEETTKNADKIAETLKENSVLVQNTINQVSDFANTNETNSEEIYSAVNAMEEILRGISEMDNATRDVMLSLQNVLGTANENGRMISDVVTQISAQNESIMNITNSTDSVRDRVNQVKETLDEINLALSRIKSAAIENKHVSSTIESLLD
ncbi:MAG: methyl-accepting chemotaxis protein, partial [Spirochaetales bacterium]|nr:methyl-accepting chemotaxis protein [Spirochaetales bacterium]